MDHVLAVLGGLAGKWWKVGICLLVPRATRIAIEKDNSEDGERLRAILMYWVLKDPVASWRKLMWRLWWSDDETLRKAADSIRHYAEELSGQSACSYYRILEFAESLHYSVQKAYVNSL